MPDFKHVCANPACGKAFTTRHERNRFCTPACFHATRRAPEWKKCLQCGEEFKPKDYRARCCSMRCSSLLRFGEKVAKVCPQCNEKFWPTAHKTQKFCSRECQGRAMSEIMRGRRKVRICVICGGTGVGKGAKTCSKECALKLKSATWEAKPVVTLTCRVCGDEFKTPNQGTKVCPQCHSQGLSSRYSANVKTEPWENLKFGWGVNAWSANVLGCDTPVEPTQTRTPRKEQQCAA